MNCVIPGTNIKVLSKAIQALSKIGDELYLEAKKDYLSFRSVNMTTTAYCTFNFLDIFFSTYDIVDPDANSESEDLVCKIPMKAVLGVFKSHGHKDKKPDFCKIELEQNATKIVFKFKYKHDVTVVRSLYLSDGQIVNVVYNKDTVVNHVSATAQLFSQVLANFHMSDDDMGLEVATNKALMRNYIAGDVNVTKGIRSQLTLTAGEFNSFKINRETTITFSLKPFRAAVHFAETFGLSVLIDFETSGKPAAIVIKNPTFEVHFIIATLKSDDATQSSLSSAALSKSKNKEHYSRIYKNITVQDQQALESVNWDNDFDMDAKTKTATKKRYSFNMNTNDNNNQTENLINGEEPVQTENLINGEEPVLSVNNKITEEDPDVVSKSPESPRSKKIKTIFGRCYEATFHATMLDLGEVLAPDSDPESD